jgi:hypothetical protein
LLVIEGIELLRAKRGDRLAAFLARVEDDDHEHDEPTG